MHPVTRAVRDLYAAYPYPATPVALKIGFDARRALSFADVERPERPIEVLDAGCSHGADLLGMAAAQPGVRFTGVDINGVALHQARREAMRRGLDNVTLAQVDLETLEGLPRPAQGYELIVCSGVIHHLVDPEAALRRLVGALAPWGVLDLMVYARAGRRGLESVAATLAEIVPDGPLEDRLARARTEAQARRGHPDWAEAADCADAEFVDRYLHPRFVSYSLEGLDALLDAAGLTFLRWTDAAAWDPACLPDAASFADCTDRARDAAVEAVQRPRVYHLLAARKGVTARPPADGVDVDRAWWALNPEGTLQRGRRVLWSGARDTGLAWAHPSRGSVPLTQGAAGLAAPFLEAVEGPFLGEDLIRWMARRDVRPATTRSLLQVLERLDVVWRPHPVDVPPRAQATTARAS